MICCRLICAEESLEDLISRDCNYDFKTHSHVFRIANTTQQEIFATNVSQDSMAMLQWAQVQIVRNAHVMLLEPPGIPHYLKNL